MFVKFLHVPIALLAAATLNVPAALGQGLQMVFRDKPPYSYVENSVHKGFLLERTMRIMSRAGIDTKFSEMPPKRIFLEIEKNEQAICSFGWYKLASREKFAHFSAPMHQDRPHTVLAAPSSAVQVRRHKTLNALMADNTLALAGADGVSYGADIDALIAAFPGKVDRTLQSPLQVAKKLAAQRADFMFIDQDDYDYLTTTHADFRGDGLVRVDYPDMPAGLKRYILCSQQTSSATMQKINAAIAAEGQF